MKVSAALRLLPRAARFVEFNRVLSARQRWSRKQHEDFQAQQLIRTVRFCAKHVPYYRRRWADHGVLVSQFHGPADLPMLPFTDKQEYLAHAGEFIPDGMSAHGLMEITTGGSTGRVSFLKTTADAVLMERAFFLRYWREHGLRWLRDTKVWFVGSLSEPSRPIQWEPVRTYRFSTYGLSPARLDAYRRFLETRAIPFLLAYPEMATRLAAHVLQASANSSALSLRAVFLGSEAATRRQRDIIERGLGARSVLHYGQGEQVALFCECPAGGGYHVITDYSHVEFGSELDNKGEREIIGTSFNNTAALLVRYRTGDYASLREDSECPCGWPFPRLVQHVVGRFGDYVVTPSGRLVPGHQLEFALDVAQPRFAECQIIQEADGRLCALAVPDAGCSSDDNQRFSRAVLEIIQEPMPFRVEWVDRIDRPGRQKKRFVVSRFRHEADPAKPE